ncbi:AMP-binding protein [Streptomyces somaliensis]|nr:AMP-binding protein [Streptomyces somaliensis]
MSTYRAPADGERVDELVAGWAEATPSAKAVVCGARRIGYGELGRLVDAEADRLRSAGLPEGGLVAVALDRSVAALVAMLGVLRAKGAYLPLDPAMPDAELHRVLEEAGPHVVLTRESYRAKVGGRPGRRVVCVDAEAEPGGGGARPRGEVDAPPTGGGTACVFLTAGTTGRPRLVRVGHHDLAAARNAWQQVHGFDARDRHVHTAPPESPEFTANWVRALCSGGTLVLPADDDPPAPRRPARGPAAAPHHRSGDRTGLRRADRTAAEHPETVRQHAAAPGDRHGRCLVPRRTARPARRARW